MATQKIPVVWTLQAGFVVLHFALFSAQAVGNIV